jgi:predicted Zn-dependent protease
MDRARKAIGDYAARFPKEPETEYLRARLELAEGDAKAAADRLGRLVPTLDRSWTQHWLGRALEATGDRAGAERRYQLALERDTNDPELYVKPIEMAERRGNWPRLVGARTSAGDARSRTTTRGGRHGPAGWRRRGLDRKR